MTFKKQVIAVSEDGRIMIISSGEMGDHEENVRKLVSEEDTTLPAGIYVADIYYIPTCDMDIDINYQLCEYRDYELYSGECKLT